MNSSPADGQYIPPQALRVGLTRAFVYNGPSMVPTFRPGQLLYVRPEARDLAPGDVVVFVNLSGDYVVHRVVAATDGGWVTRGDNNRLPDALPVAYGQVVGRVELAEYGGRLSPVAGGPAALRRVRLAWTARCAVRWVRRIFGLPYRLLRRSGLARRAFGPYFVPWLQVVHVETRDGPVLKALYRGRVVARCWPVAGRFECRKPYDLMLWAEDLGCSQRIRRTD